MPWMIAVGAMGNEHPAGSSSQALLTHFPVPEQG